MNYYSLYGIRGIIMARDNEGCVTHTAAREERLRIEETVIERIEHLLGDLGRKLERLWHYHGKEEKTEGYARLETSDNEPIGHYSLHISRHHSLHNSTEFDNHTAHWTHADHDSLEYLGLGAGHDPLWLFHRYSSVGHHHNEGEHLSYSPHYSFHVENDHEFQGRHADYDPLTHIMYLGIGHGHDPLQVFHLYQFHGHLIFLNWLETY